MCKKFTKSLIICFQFQSVLIITIKEIQGREIVKEIIVITDIQIIAEGKIEIVCGTIEVVHMIDPGPDMIIMTVEEDNKMQDEIVKIMFIKFLRLFIGSSYIGLLQCYQCSTSKKDLVIHVKELKEFDV